jgi:hypothetical protein
MRGRDRRRFTLADIMVLVAASACALALTRYLSPDPKFNTVVPGKWISNVLRGKPAYLAIALAAALIVLRWISPRPSLARLVRQPGFVACVATVGGLALGSGLSEMTVFVMKANPNRLFTTFSPGYSLSHGISMIPFVVAGAWLALALGGRWTPEKSWIDRAGRCVGFFWVAGFPLMFFQSLITYLVPYVRFLD